MMDETEIQKEGNALIFSIIYRDEHLQEVRGVLNYGSWSGVGTAYCNHDAVLKFADELQSFSKTLTGEAIFDLGSANGAGSVKLTFFCIDAARHIRCHVELSGGGINNDARPSEIPKLAIEVGVEPAAIEDFVRELTSVETKLGLPAKLKLN